MARQTIFGWHTVLHLLEHAPERVIELYRQGDRDDARARRLDQLIEVTGIHVQTLARDRLDALVSGGNHQGLAAAIRPSAEQNESDLEACVERAGDELLLLVLDGVQDPHNLGACLRNADGAGCHGVVVPKRRAVGLTDTVRKVASGAAETVPLFRVTNLARTLAQLGEAGVWRVATSDRADSSLFDVDLPRPLALVMGGEAKGVRRLTAERCDALASLPMRGAVSSLNVSVAAGISLYEAVRRRIASPDAKP